MEIYSLCEADFFFLVLLTLLGLSAILTEFKFCFSASLLEHRKQSDPVGGLYFGYFVAFCLWHILECFVFLACIPSLYVTLQ